MQTLKRICAIGVDVDTLEDYVNSYGYKGRGIPQHDHVYTKALPRILELFARFNIRGTFFVVGRDIKSKENVAILREIVEQGHEIANHTMNHFYPFSALSRDKKREEIVLMQKIAEDKLGYRVGGFRAPGYGIDAETIQILEEEGYVYDSSVHPTYFMSLVNIYVFLLSAGKKLPEMKNCCHCFAPRSTYYPKNNLFFLRAGGTRKIIEVPITVTPLLRMPFYGTFHLWSGKRIFDFGYYFLQKAKTDINYEIHAIEMLDSVDEGLSSWFSRQPGLGISWANKKKRYHHIMRSFEQGFVFSPIITLAKKGVS